MSKDQVGATQRDALVAEPPRREAAPGLLVSFDRAGCGSLIGLTLKNTLLSVLTLGIYAFWARTEVRRRIWSAVRIDGEPLAYRGTGGEVFRGAVVFGALLLVAQLVAAFLPALVGMVWPGGEAEAEKQIQRQLLALFGLLGMFALYSGIRYRAGRTAWRGIRFGQTGTAARYAFGRMGWLVATALTVGLASPWAAAAERRARIGTRSFGSEPFRFEGRGIALVPSALVALGMVVGPPGAVIAASWSLLVEAVEQSRRMSSFERGFGAFGRAHPEVLLPLLVLLPIGLWLGFAFWQGAKTGFTLAGIRIGGLRVRTRRGPLAFGMRWVLLSLATLGSLFVLVDWAERERVRFAIRQLDPEGRLDLAEIVQGAREAGSEGLASVLSFDDIAS